MPTFPTYHGELPECLNPLNPRHWFLLLYWIYFRPTAFKCYLYQADPDLYRAGPGKSIFRTWRSPAYRNLYVTAIIATVLLSILIGLPDTLFINWLQETPMDWLSWVRGVAYGVVGGVTLGVTTSVALSVVGGVVVGVATGMAYGVALSVMGGVVEGVMFGVALSVMGGVVVGVAFGGRRGGKRGVRCGAQRDGRRGGRRGVRRGARCRCSTFYLLSVSAWACFV